MAPFQSRFQRKTAILVGVLAICIVLYTTLLLHSVYGRNVSNMLSPPKIDLSTLASSSPIHPPDTPSLSDIKTQPLDLPNSSLNLPNKDHEQDAKPSLHEPTSAESSAVTHKVWEFNVTRDERAYGLSPDQCDSSFPGLFTEIDRAMTTRKGVGKYTADDIDISWREYGTVRAAIVDQQLYIVDTRLSGSVHETPRILATLHAIHRSIIASRTPLPDTEFSFVTSDFADPGHLNKTIWALSRTADQEEIWLMPDFGYWSWPLNLVGGYEQIRQEIADTEFQFHEKKKQALWRGAVNTNEHRKDLLRVTKDKEWADIKAIEWSGAADPTVSDGTKPLSMPEHCQYQFLVHTEGRSYSGRGKYLQNCNSVIIIPKRTWIEPHHNLLVASGHKQNFVEVEKDFSNLEEKILELLEDPDRAQLIAQNSVETFRDRYLTPAAQACYWRRLITTWADVSFTPEARKVGEDGIPQKVRGVPFETFVIQTVTEMKPKCHWWSKILFIC